MKQDKIDNIVEHLKGFGSFRQMAEYVLSLMSEEEDCPHCGGEGFVYSTHYADPYATTRRCECTERDPDEKYEQQNDK